MTKVDVECVEGLVAACDDLSPLIEDHLDYYEELLPYVFMGEVVHKLITETVGGCPPATARCVFDYLEKWSEGRDRTAMGFIRIAFLDLLPAAEEPGRELLSLLGARLYAERGSS